MNRLDAIPDACPFKPRYQSVAGRCKDATCDKPLPPRRRLWCSDKCAGQRDFWRHHHFNIARSAALHRDGHRCVRCGANGQPPKDELDAIGPRPSPPEGLFERSRYWDTDEGRAYRTAVDAYKSAQDTLHRRYQLEVNHIRPAQGAHAEVSCVHHLDNLETLCGPCHRRVTATQARQRADQRARRLSLLEDAS